MNNPILSWYHYDNQNNVIGDRITNNNPLDFGSVDLGMESTRKPYVILYNNISGQDDVMDAVECVITTRNIDQTLSNNDIVTNQWTLVKPENNIWYNIGSKLVNDEYDSVDCNIRGENNLTTLSGKKNNGSIDDINKDNFAILQFKVHVGYDITCQNDGFYIKLRYKVID